MQKKIKNTNINPPIFLSNEDIYKKVSIALSEISGLYYLIPNINKFLDKVLDFINLEFSLIGSGVYYLSHQKDNSIVTRNSKSASLSSDQISSYINKIIELNSNLFSEKKVITLDNYIAAYTIPVFYESVYIALLILLNDKSTLPINNIILDYIEIYLSTALIANYYIKTKESNLQESFNFNANNEISIKRILEWRLQEIMDSFLCTSNENDLFKEISFITQKLILKTALNKTNENKSQAAKLLGLNRNTLRKKLKDLKVK